MSEVPAYPRIPYGEADFRRIHLNRWLYVDKTRFLRRAEEEYDNFANTVLAYHGAEAYHSFTHGGGFYRNFFATLKSGAERSGGGLERLFTTGVSPITMDDVTSGFNIGKNIILHPDFNEMVGFTEQDVRHLVETYRELGVFNQDPAAATGIMGEWYNGYRFAEEAETDLYRLEQLMMRMANDGEWRTAFEFLGEAIARQTGIRDYIAGEKVVQGFLAAYLNVTEYYVFRSEAELGKGHADIILEQGWPVIRTCGSVI